MTTKKKKPAPTPPAPPPAPEQPKADELEATAALIRAIHPLSLDARRRALIAALVLEAERELVSLLLGVPPRIEDRPRVAREM